jgi:hypothetical protein
VGQGRAAGGLPAAGDGLAAHVLRRVPRAPISQLLYAPGSPPASVAIQDNLGNYHFGVGMAQSVLAVAVAMLAVAAVLGGYRLLAPAGWRRIGGVRSG